MRVTRLILMIHRNFAKDMQKFRFRDIRITPFLRQFRCYYSQDDAPRFNQLQELCNIVSGVGGLDELEKNLSQAKLIITPFLVSEVIHSCKSEIPNRRLLRFFSWSKKKLKSKLDDEVFNQIIRISAQKEDLVAVNILLSDFRREHRKMEIQTFSVLVETLVKLGREDNALGIFKNLENFKCNKEGVFLNSIVYALCAKGHVRKAEGVIWHHKDDIPIEPCVYQSLLHGYCVQKNVKEARKVVDKMYSLSINPGLVSYNTFLRCICERNLRFNPSGLVPQATDLMMEMKIHGVSPVSSSFNILLSCLGRCRRVKESCQILNSMRNMGCDPDWVSYFLVIRVLYLSGRFGRGNRIVDQVIEEKMILSSKFFYGLIGVLCGVEKIDHALDLFERMKKTNVEDYGSTYDLLISKICRAGNFEKGKKLWDEAMERGVTLQCSIDLLDPSRTEIFKPMRNEERKNINHSRRIIQVKKKFIKLKGKRMKRRKT